ncbi:hypothetical protein LWI28_022927 [Acer negundo]|uniref:Uncharacterized protein n=1 Tax=Acer negundo TaxID=4023 RepID=A0AAD5JF05_ACENE|nr:hypothetical protein LWI28_022927 [Acer negundo]
MDGGRKDVAPEVLTLVSICQLGGNQQGNSADAVAADHSNSVDAAMEAGVVAAAERLASMGEQLAAWS